MTTRPAIVEDIVAILREHNWRKTGGIAEEYEVWESRDAFSSPVPFIVLPLAETRGDFDMLVDRASHTMTSLGMTPPTIEQAVTAEEDAGE